MAKILIIDDSRIAAALARSVLEEAGHEVITREGPSGLPAILKREQPDLVLLDVEIPDIMDGPDALRAVRARGWQADTVVLLYSAKPAEELEELAKACGANGFVQKAETKTRLAAIVTEHLSQAG